MKRTAKKLTLAKETLRILEDGLVQEVVGGVSTMPGTCNISCVTDITCVCGTIKTNCC